MSASEALLIPQQHHAQTHNDHMSVELTDTKTHSKHRTLLTHALSNTYEYMHAHDPHIKSFIARAKYTKWATSLAERERYNGTSHHKHTSPIHMWESEWVTAALTRWHEICVNRMYMLYMLGGPRNMCGDSGPYMPNSRRKRQNRNKASRQSGNASMQMRNCRKSKERNDKRT